MTSVSSEFEDPNPLLVRALDGDQSALKQLFTLHRDRLKRMVRLRLDRRLQDRVEASDIVQQAFLDASARLRQYQPQPGLSFFLWLRRIAVDQLLHAHRLHLKSEKREAGQEISIYNKPMPDACSISLAQQLLGRLVPPAHAAQRAELQIMVQDVLNAMDSMDREVLVLRNFEQLSNAEAAYVLGIKKSVASSRYISALRRLRQTLNAIPGIDQQPQ